MRFTEFTLHSEIQSGLADAGYETCMPVQEQVLKNGLEGADLYVQSQTGTGKTAAYLITILQRLMSDPALAGRNALVMVPTRELAVQVEEEAKILCAHTRLKAASFYGGVGYGRQQEQLQQGVDIIIGTPGRVIDLQQSRTMDLSKIAFLVIDEADRMFDMGFYPDLRTLLGFLPKSGDRQTMLFSATLNSYVKNLAWEYTVEAREVTIESDNITVDEINQQLFHVPSNEKMKLLLGIFRKEVPESMIVFCNTKRMSEIVSKRLKINGIESEFIIGDLPQSKRLQVIESFKSGSLRCLVATDVAARGIDVNDLAMVINYDLPNEAENYVHRIGRTARAGKTGKAYSFCSEQDVYNLPAIEKYIEKKIPITSATDDLFIEDKSAHVYIRTDRYDNDYDDAGRGRGRDSRSSGGGRGGDRGPRRDDRGPRRDDRGPRRDDRPAGDRPARQEGSAHATAPHGPAPRRDDRHQGPRTAPRDQRAGGEAVRDEGREERELAKLSFEERMAYYKNKYGTEGKPTGQTRPAGAHPAANSSPRPPREGGRNGQSGRPQGEHRGNRNGDQRRDEGTQRSKDSRGQQPAGNRPPATNGTPSTQRPTQGKRNVPNQGKPVAAAAPASAKPAAKAGGFGGLIKKLFGKK